MQERKPESIWVDHYLLRDVVGRGATGQVYTAVDDRAPDRLVAAKLLLDPRGLEPLLRAARSLQSLDHPGIVRVLDCIELAQPVELGGGLRAFAGLVMPYLPAGSLAGSLARLRQGQWQMDLPDATGLLRHLVEALGHAHERGVLHRDLKPSNVLFHRDGQPVLTDAGLELPAEQLLGSPLDAAALSYLSPEQIEGGPLTPASDVYALGVLLHQMVTGELPPGTPPGRTAPAEAGPHAPRPASQLRDDLPAGAADVLGRALARQPEARWQTPAALLQAWLAALGQGPAASCAAPRRIAGEPSFVGREEETSTLMQAFDGSRRGQPAFVLLTGEGGIGKTALVDRFVRQAKREYPELFFGRSEGGVASATASTSFSAFSQALEDIIRQAAGLPVDFAPVDAPAAWEIPPALRSVCRVLARSAPAVVAATVPSMGLGGAVENAVLTETGLGSPLWQAATGRVRDRETMNRLTFIKQFCRALVELSRWQPLILALDCLEQTDGDSWQLLEQLTLQAQVDSARILLVGCMRLEEPKSSEGRTAYANLLPCAIAVRVGSRQPRTFVTRFVGANCAGLAFDGGFLDRLTEHTGANPRLLTATLNFLDGEGLLALPEQRRLAGRPEFDKLKLPSDVTPLLQSQVGDLTDRSRSVLQHASVQGRVFVREILASTLHRSPPLPWRGLDEDAISVQVGDELCQAPQLVILDPPAYPRLRLGRLWATRHTFSNGLLRDFLYQRWDATTRRHIHLWTGLALERLYGENAGSIAPQLAYHFAQSEQEPHRALFYASRVARVLYDRYSMPAVHEWCDLALSAAADLAAGGGAQDPALPSLSELEWEVRELKGDAFFFDGHWKHAREQYERLLRSLPPAPRDARALNRAGDMLRRIGETWRCQGRQPAGLKKFRHALDLLEASPLAAPAQIALLQREIGYVLEQQSEVGTTDEALLRYKVALDLVQDDPQQWALTASLYTCCGCAYERRVDVEAGDELTAEQLHDLGEALGWHNRAVDLRSKPLPEDPTLARDRQALAGALSNRAIVYEKLRDWDRCEADHREAIRLLTEVGHVVGLAMARLNYGEMLRQLDRPNEAAEEYGESLQAFIQAQDRLGELIDHLNLSLVREPQPLREAHVRRALTLAVLDRRWDWLGFVMAAYQDRCGEDGADARRRMEQWLLQPSADPGFPPEAATLWGAALADHARLVRLSRRTDWRTRLRAKLEGSEGGG